VGVSNRTDADLLQAARSDPEAFMAFYDRYEAGIVGYLGRRARDSYVVADLTSEVFAAALGSAPRYKPTEATAANWLFTIAHNIWANSVRARQVEERARLRLGIRDAVSFTDDELERVERLASGTGWLLELLNRLPPEQASAIRARVLDERDYDEIAAELETSSLVIRKRVSRGLGTLRKSLSEEGLS
jgi:RNA polymerase sigma factor (sigma-70 family)